MGVVVSGHLKLIEKCSEKSVPRWEVSRREGDCREGEFLHTLGLDSGADVLGLPVLHSLDQEHDGGGDGRKHQHRPDGPGGPGLTLVDVREPVDAGGGEELVQLSPEFGKYFMNHDYSVVCEKKLTVWTVN